jgi:hypothetical protein
VRRFVHIAVARFSAHSEAFLGRDFSFAIMDTYECLEDYDY